jgi:CRP-like cAMP-binding protein
MEFLTGTPGAASVRARTPARALVLAYDRLRAQLEAGDAATLQVFFHIAQVIARRLAAMNRKFAELEQRGPGNRFHELRDFQHRLMSEWTV